MNLVRPLAMLAALTVTACVHTQRCPSNLHEALQLRALPSAEPVLRGAKHEFRFALENTSAEPVEFCFLTEQGGVSVRLVGNGYMRPLIVHGITTDTRCAERVRLEAQQARTLSEEVWIPRDAPEHVAVRGSLSFEPLAECRSPGEYYDTSVSTEVTIADAK